MAEVVVRLAVDSDKEAIWSIMEPIILSGEAYALDTDMTQHDAISYWFLSNHEVYVALHNEEIVGTYFLCNNQKGNGKHVSNCGYMVSSQCQGKGVANTMCLHSLARAKAAGFKSMQYNYVVSSNERAVKLWQKHDFKIVGTLPHAFNHPKLGYVDVYVMFRDL